MAWSSKNGSDDKPHAVCVTFPAQGHVNPMMQLAKLLHSRGFYITFVNTEFNHNRLIRSKGSSDWVNRFPDFKFVAMPEGLPASDRDATQDVYALCDSLRRNSLSALRNLLDRVRSNNDSPPITCIVSDAFMSCAIKAAEEIGVPQVQFWTASACGFMGYLQYPELLRRGIIPFKNENYEHDGTLDMAVDWIPGMPNIRLRDLPSFIRITNADDILFTFVRDEVQNCLKAPTIIFNTFDSMEHRVLEAIKSIYPNNYTIGPISSLERKYVPESPLKSFRPSLWKDDTQCIDWLAQKKPKSVIYVNYGCVTVMTKEALIEFAWGLANSKHPFLWVLRPDVMMGESGSLPDEFIKETKDRGLIVSWCPQDQVLGHPSVGVFLTHCGWNSLVEGVCESGVPVICWPFFAEQQTNCRYACLDDEWGIGVEVNHVVKREEVECLVREMMEGERGKRSRRKALEWQEKAKETTHVGGSSFSNFDTFVNIALGRGV